MKEYTVGSETRRRVGRCIYCGATENLTTEHVLPHGLGGRWTLVEASCPDCNKVTSLCERHVQREQLLLPRVVEGMQKRHHETRPQNVKLEVLRDGKWESMQVPVDMCAGMFGMLVFQEPRHVAEYEYRSRMKVIAGTFHGSNLEALLQRLGATSIRPSAVFRGNSFGRMLAKIGYGMAVLKYGLDELQECYVRPCILGKKDDTGRWVGSSGRDVRELPKGSETHIVDLVEIDGEVHAVIRLFANYGTPEYRVVVGRLR